MRDDFKEARNLTGDIRHNRATQIDRVKKIDTAVLMARIWPNLANSWIVARHKGMDATIVVMAELRMAVPMCDTAANDLQPRISYQVKKKIALSVMDIMVNSSDLWGYGYFLELQSAIKRNLKVLSSRIVDAMGIILFCHSTPE